MSNTFYTDFKVVSSCVKRSTDTDKCVASSCGKCLTPYCHFTVTNSLLNLQANVSCSQYSQSNAPDVNYCYVGTYSFGQMISEYYSQQLNNFYTYCTVWLLWIWICIFFLIFLFSNNNNNKDGHLESLSDRRLILKHMCTESNTFVL